MQHKRKIIGILSLLFFIGIIAYSQYRFSPVGFDIVTRLKMYKELLSGFREPAAPIVRQSIVEEESTTIDVVTKVSPAVVSVVVSTLNYDPFSDLPPEQSQEEGIGTGFIVAANGLIVTNSHVVNSVDGEYSVVLSTGTTYKVSRVHFDEQSDLAILEVDARGLPVVELGDSDSVRVGQKAIAIGNALGRFSNTVTVGVVSGVARGLTAVGGLGESKTYENALQTDAALNPGNSGGPLLNSAGQVIGINVATTRGADNIGFAIPVNTLKPILDSFLKEGRIVRPYIGVVYSIITPEVAKLRDFPQGAYVSRVLPNSPAAKAAIRRSDIIIEVDGKAITVENSLAEAISEKKVGDLLAFTIDRNGTVLDVDVILAEAPDTLLK